MLGAATDLLANRERRAHGRSNNATESAQNVLPSCRRLGSTVHETTKLKCYDTDILAVS